MTPREELIEIISKTKLPDGCPLGKSFVLVNDEELEIASVLADAILAAGYRKGFSPPPPHDPLTCPCCTAITAAVEAQREKWWEFVLWLNGERGDFPERQDGQGIYYWRREMMKRAAAIREG